MSLVILTNGVLLHSCNLQVELYLSQLLGQAKASVYIKATANAPIVGFIVSDTVVVFERISISCA